ncbi:MAG: DEAD/DEAH box helicase [Candidatus Omnitrophica bacterium]|nr:DEAD/DEAH box helicase [Candidatus Omnitrophota bacterium]MCM8790237.1 DEAD/DEAH box helicase [Candidatus Omnitrophota bacterium]
MYTYDRFQQEAIDCINEGRSVIVSAPTGAGKTAIAEHVIDTCIKRHQGVIYTAPIKALSNQKFRDFQAMYQDNIGILTGDVSINADAPVLIMTTEIFRNKVLDNPEGLNKYSWIIFDEVHYIDNPERGTVWEESLIFLPDHMNILCLSATIPNIGQFAKWIETIHKKEVRVVVENKRPVPLHFFYQCHNQVFDSLSDLKRTRAFKPNTTHHLIKYIRQRDGLPCIYFVFGRKRAEYLADELYSFNFLTKDEETAILKMFDELCEKYELTGEKSAGYMRHLVQRGIAFHHAGMLPTLKEVVERLFTSRLLKVIFTTETFALGINMPSRSVVFDELRKFYGNYVRNLKTRDFYQMAGRAGRRGIDKEGFVYTRVNLHRIRAEEVKAIIYGKPEDVKSQFNASYATLLNLYDKYKEGLFDIYPRSLHYYQTKKHQQIEAVRLMQAKLKLLREAGCIEEGELTMKGNFAKAVYGYELLLTHLYGEGVFEELDETGLGVLAVAAVFEPRKNQRLVSVSKQSRAIKDICEKASYEIRRMETRNRIYPFSKPPYFHLAKAMECWLNGMKFQKVLQFTDTDEGELIRYFRMAAQILREIKDAPISTDLRSRVANAIRYISRDVVDAEKQLREG